MTKNDLDFCIRTLTELFTKAEFNETELELWGQQLSHCDRETAIHAIRSHRISSDKPWPVLAKVLELARVRSQDREVEDNDNSRREAIHAQRVREDDDATLRLLESLTQQDLDELAEEGRRIGGGQANSMFPIPYSIAKASKMSRGFMGAAFAMSPKFGFSPRST